MTAAAPAAAQVSPTSKGAWQVPASKMPATDTSTGRSLGWTSWRKRSAPTGIFSFSTRSAMSLGSWPTASTTRSTGTSSSSPKVSTSFTLTSSGCSRRIGIPQDLRLLPGLEAEKHHPVLRPPGCRVPPDPGHRCGCPGKNQRPGFGVALPDQVGGVKRGAAAGAGAVLVQITAFVFLMDARNLAAAHAVDHGHAADGPAVQRQGVAAAPASAIRRMNSGRVTTSGNS